MHTQRFEELDLNHDGVIDRQESRAALNHPDPHRNPSLDPDPVVVRNLERLNWALQRGI